MSRPAPWWTVPLGLGLLIFGFCGGVVLDDGRLAVAFWGSIPGAGLLTWAGTLWTNGDMTRAQKSAIVMVGLLVGGIIASWLYIELGIDV